MRAAMPAIVGLPLDAAQVLRLMCTDLVMPENVADQPSVPPSIEKERWWIPGLRKT